MSSKEVEESPLQHVEEFVLSLVLLTRIPTMDFNQGSHIGNSQ